MTSAIGRTVGNYRIVNLLGVGGMGSVYLAEHERIERQVAIKVLHQRLATDPEMNERFFNEALASNRIRHPGIVEIFDCGVDPTLGVYLIMEYLRGETLEMRLERDELEFAVSCSIVQQVADALSAAHRASIVHRDLKPGNIFLLESGQQAGGATLTKLVDFGVAKLIESNPAEGLTRAGDVFGTPRFMSPEQFEDSRSVDHRTDIYSLGLIAYRLLCGRGPFDHLKGPELVQAQMFQPPPQPTRVNPDLPVAVDAVLLKAIAKTPEERYDDIALLPHQLAVACAVGRDEVQVSLAQTAVEATPPSFASLATGGQRTASEPELLADVAKTRAVAVGQAAPSSPPSASAPSSSVPPETLDQPTALLTGEQIPTTARWPEDDSDRAATRAVPLYPPASAAVASGQQTAQLSLTDVIEEDEVDSLAVDEQSAGHRELAERLRSQREADPPRARPRSAGRRLVPLVAGGGLLLVAGAVAAWLGASAPLPEFPAATGLDQGRWPAAATTLDAQAGDTLAGSTSDGPQTAMLSGDDAAARDAGDTRPRLLWLATSPSGARVTAGSQVLGLTPLEAVRVPPDIDRLTIARAGYVARVLRLDPGPRELRYRGIRLRRAPRKRRPRQKTRRQHAPSTAKLQVVTLYRGRIVAANILIDGRPMGQTPLYLERLAPGLRRVTARLAGFRRATRRVRLVPGSTRKVVLQLERSR